MTTKKTKLVDQFNDDGLEEDGGDMSKLFDGVSVYVNGLTGWFSLNDLVFDLTEFFGNRS